MLISLFVFELGSSEFQLETMVSVFLRYCSEIISSVGLYSEKSEFVESLFEQNQLGIVNFIEPRLQVRTLALFSLAKIDFFLDFYGQIIWFHLFRIWKKERNASTPKRRLQMIPSQLYSWRFIAWGECKGVFWEIYGGITRVKDWGSLSTCSSYSSSESFWEAIFFRKKEALKWILSCSLFT